MKKHKPTIFCDNAYSTEVKLFAETNNVVSLLNDAILLVEKRFKSIKEIKLEIHNDPDSMEKWIPSKEYLKENVA